MPLPYGFMRASDSHIILDPQKANIVKTIYQQYLSGMSLGRIADFLFGQQIPSPKGKSRWTQPVISNILSNKSISAILSASMTSFWYKAKRAGAAILMQIPTNGRPPGITPRAY